MRTSFVSSEKKKKARPYFYASVGPLKSSSGAARAIDFVFGLGNSETRKTQNHQNRKNSFFMMISLSSPVF
jgi:hypothetical protein